MCRTRLGEDERRLRGCGFIKQYREAGPAADPKAIGRGLVADSNGFTWVPTVCPGYSSSLPQVREAVAAFNWFQKSQPIASRYPGEELTPDLIEAIDILAGIYSQVEAWEWKEKKL